VNLVPEPELMSAVEFAGHHTKIAAVSPYICWRLVQLLVPMHELLIAVREQVQKDNHRIGGDDTEPSVPYMEEFLDFVCDDKRVILQSEDWP